MAETPPLTPEDKQGREAYEAGAELADNPYRAGTDAHSRWVWGWRDASEHV